MRPDDLADAEAIALGLHLTEGQIRVWATRGLIARHGKTFRGRTLYSLDEVRRVAVGCDVHQRSACRTCFGKRDG